MRAGGSALPHVRGLDGVRGVAVAVVLAFHAQAAWAGGGFLGVSLFFTLSGSLIPQLLGGEHGATGTIALRSFWGRRVRRLAPAALLCLTAVALLTRFTDVFPGRAAPGDVVAA